MVLSKKYCPNTASQSLTSIEMCTFYALVFVLIFLNNIFNNMSCKFAPSGTSCFTSESESDLEFADEPGFSFPENSVFFIETTCKGGLNFRQACSIESAARSNPDRPIIVLFAGLVIRSCLESKPMSSLRWYKNVKFYRIRLNKFVAGTPVEKLVSKGFLNRSHFPIQHMSNVLRYTLLYKFGGIYLDLDMMIVKPFDWLPETKNFVGKADDYVIGSAVIAMANSGIGKVVADKTLGFLNDFYKPKSFYFNSAHVITEVLKQTCSTKDVDLMSTITCHGFKVYEKNFFYPISKKKWKQYFQNYQNSTLDRAFGFHIWNRMSKKEGIPKYSLYGDLIHKYCPQVNKINTLKKLRRLRPQNYFNLSLLYQTGSKKSNGLQVPEDDQVTKAPAFLDVLEYEDPSNHKENPQFEAPPEVRLIARR